MKSALPAFSALVASALLAAAPAGAASPDKRFNLRGHAVQLAYEHRTSDGWTWSYYLTATRNGDTGKEWTFLDFYTTGCAPSYWYCEAHYGWGSIPNEQFEPKPNGAVLAAQIADGPNFTVRSSSWGVHGHTDLEPKTGSIRLTFDEYGQTLEKQVGVWELVHSGGVTQRSNVNSETRTARVHGTYFEYMFGEGDGVTGKAGTFHNVTREWLP